MSPLERIRESDPHRPEHQVRSSREFITAKNIDYIRREAAENARQVLERNRDLIPAKNGKAFIERETNAAVMARRAKLEAGLINSDRCDIPGIRIYLTEAGKNCAAANCREAGHPISENDWQEVKPGVWLIEFPEGIYAAVSRRALISRDTKPFHGTRRGTLDFEASFGVLIRIEGTNSTALWQNMNYNWDLTPRF